MYEYKALGVAIHTIQDAQVHQGGRWVADHEKQAGMLDHCNQHPNLGCTFDSNIEGAYIETYKIFDSLINNKPYKFQLHNNHSSEHNEEQCND